MPMIRRFVPFGEYTPDAYSYGNPNVRFIRNAMPLDDGTYGPVKAGVEFSDDSISAQVRGAFSGRSAAGNVTNFAATATALWKLNSNATWSDVKSGTYALPADELWDAAQFGERVLFTDFIDAVQAWTLDSSVAFAALGGSPPKARCIAVWEPGFVVLGNLDVSGTTYPSGLQWCAYNDVTDWPTPGTADAASKQSDRSVLASGGWVRRLVGPVGGAKGAVFCDSSIWRAEYVGPPTVFNLIEVVRGIGTPTAPRSVINVAVENGQNLAFFWSGSGFFGFDGLTCQPIGRGKVDTAFRDALNADYEFACCAFAIPGTKSVAWSVPDSGGNFSHIFVFNWSTGRWTYLDSPYDNGSFITTLLTTGYTLDALDTLGYTMETLPFSLDSRVWTGGDETIGIFAIDGVLSYPTGSNLAARFITGEVDGGGGRRVFCSGIRPVVERDPVRASGTLAPTANVSYRDGLDDDYTDASATSQGADGVCPQRASARYMRAQVDIPAGHVWHSARGVEVHMKPEGLR